MPERRHETFFGNELNLYRRIENFRRADFDFMDTNSSVVILFILRQNIKKLVLFSIVRIKYCFCTISPYVVKVRQYSYKHISAEVLSSPELPKQELQLNVLSHKVIIFYRVVSKLQPALYSLRFH